ncbi:hypothetical protein CDCA_CDCA16G4129 [Cyanidium caldarium]|uniref:Retinoblastoma-associated protein A-box domain-containing protein n=1 Tax=Cyanidium caldarium TaxID=2771 RepID=A0AAV9J0N3_CYACA|nr:hypothetical protein CDCA_CDCA16G4129 [Cyanidium caldarium]
MEVRAASVASSTTSSFRGVESAVWRLAQRAQLPESMARAAVACIAKVKYPDDEEYWAACALVAVCDCDQQVGQVLTALLAPPERRAEASPDVCGSANARVTDFFERVKLLSPRARQLEQYVTVMANVFRKFDEMVSATADEAERAWVYFLTAAALLSTRAGPLGELPDVVSAYHLMVAVARQMRLPVSSAVDTVEGEVQRYVQRLQTLPLDVGDWASLQRAYAQAVVGRFGFDGRIFLGAKELSDALSTSPTASAAASERTDGGVLARDLALRRRQRVQHSPLPLQRKRARLTAPLPPPYAAATPTPPRLPTSEPTESRNALACSSSPSPPADDRGALDELAAAAAALQNLSQSTESRTAPRTPPEALRARSTPTRPPPSPRRTPIRGGIASVRWVRAMVELSRATRDTLHSTYAPHGADAERFVDSARRLLHLSFDPRFNEETASQRIEEALAVYFHALESVLRAESQRLNRSVEFAPKLLAIDAFHKSLLLCAVETVCASYGIRDELHFDRLLVEFDLSAFEFLKVITSFVNTVENLPPQAKRRLTACQECVLSVLGWHSTSPLVTALRSGRGESESVPAAAVDLFFSKLLTQVSYRLLCICYRLGLHDESFESRAWAVFKHALAEQWELFVGRHVDTIVMCSVYGAGKVLPEVLLKFSDVIAAYKAVVAGSECVRPCDSLQAVFRDVPLDDGERGDVIAFYNMIFIPHMKRFLLGDTAPTTTSDAGTVGGRSASQTPQHLSPVSSPGPGSRLRDKIVSSPLRVPRVAVTPAAAMPNATVSAAAGASPMTPWEPSPPPALPPSGGVQSGQAATTDARATLTPATRQLYSFGSSPLGRRRLTFS